MTVRALLTLGGVALSLIFFGAMAPGHDWAVSAGVLVAVIASFLLAMLIFVIDYGFGAFFKLIGVLES